jgi:3-hydroxyacyl-CoA dehydrogenase / enoyl-CoA hydratase / 3-hydroxybutyryl-CoA epimerase
MHAACCTTGPASWRWSWRGGAPAAAPRKPLLKRALDGTPVGRRVVLRQARAGAEGDEGALPRPAGGAATWCAAREAAAGRGAGRRGEAVGRLVVTDVSKNLIHVFHLLEAAKKAGPGGPVEPRRRRARRRAGRRRHGRRHRAAAAYRGIDVRLKDINADALGLGLRHARQMFDRLVRRGRLERATRSGTWTPSRRPSTTAASARSTS